MSKLKVFVSSVQKELESERLAVLQLISTDPFLNQNCEAVLYELEPASPSKAPDESQRTVESCDIYVCIIGQVYGSTVGKLSITHREYRAARDKGLHIFIYIKGSSELSRAVGTKKMIKEIRGDGFIYKRFDSLLSLHAELRFSLVDLLRKKYGIERGRKERLPPRRKPFIFLSYAKEDKRRVKTIYQRLLMEGLNPWLDLVDLVPGEEWETAIIRAIKDARFVIVFLSNRSVSKRGYAQKEIKEALNVADTIPDGEIFIIPARLEECAVPERLSRWQWVDLFRPHGLKKIMTTLKNNFRPETL